MIRCNRLLQKYFFIFSGERSGRECLEFHDIVAWLNEGRGGYFAARLPGGWVVKVPPDSAYFFSSFSDAELMQ